LRPADEWRCGGELVPPTGWQQDTAFADATLPDAREQAAQRAASKLADRLCGGDPAACGALRARITTWKTGSNGKELCAMAVVKASDLEDWRKSALSLGKLDTDLAQAAEALLAAKITKTARLAIDRILDNGIPGGQRADWLRARLEHHLASRVQLVTPPRGWAGDGLPSGVDVALRGEMVARREGQVVVVEANLRTLKSAGKGTAVVGSARVSFPESAAPSPGAAAAVKPFEDSSGLSVHVETHAGGSLCAGEHTQVWLKSESDTVVAVLNLYGSAEGILQYPDDSNPGGKLKAGASAPLAGKEGYDVVPVPGSEYERFIALAASSAAGLGRFAGVKGPCRLPAGVARELHQGQGLPSGAKVASDGYRLVQSNCGATVIVDEDRRRQAAAAVTRLPECALTMGASPPSPRSGLPR
jgi:hypothetical protein